MRSSWSARSFAAHRRNCASRRSRRTRSSDWRRLFRRLEQRGLEDRRTLARLDPAFLDLLRPVTGDLVAGGDLAQRWDLLAAAALLDEGAARVEPSGPWRVRRARQIAGQQDRLALLLDNRIRNRHRREERDRVRVERVLVELSGRR